MKKDTGQGISFALQGIKTEQFAMFEKNYSPKKNTALDTEIQFKLDQENERIGVFIGFEFKQTKKEILKIQVSCHFKIEESSWEAFTKKDKFLVPKDFLAHLAMITTGTARGVLFAKTEATPFSIFIIPTLNVAEMIKEDASFELNR
jgi:hypothetical protein